MTTYYVSSEIGKSSNVGTSAAAPLATLQAAANLVKPGDTVQVMNGTYSAVTITTSGTASAPITFEAAPGQTPVVNSSGSWNGIDIQASYIVINGFTVVGDAANYNLSQAMAGYGGNPNLCGNGIDVQSPGNGIVPHHIIIENNTVYNEPGGGIATNGADYVQILNNTVHDNAHWSAYGASGISIFMSKNIDTNPGAHFIVSGNLSYNNSQLVPTGGLNNKITDGEGIILDSNNNSGYTGQILVQNNTTYGNGGPGIESFATANVAITGNTVYGNATQGRQTGNDAQIFINTYGNGGSPNNTVSNNTTTAPSTPPASAPSAPTIASFSTDSGTVGDHITNDKTLTLTGTAAANSTVTVLDGSTQIGTTTANSSGSWSYITSVLTDAIHVLKATDTVSGVTSAASSPLSVTVDTTAPTAPVLVTNSVVNTNHVLLSGTAEANSVVTVLDGATTVGTATTASNGTWSVTTNALSSGAHDLTATATDVAGNVSAVSQPMDPLIPAPPTAPGAPVIAKFSDDSGVADDHITNDNTLTLSGTAVAGSAVKVFDGNQQVGTATADSTGNWSATSALADGAHKLSATATSGGQTSASSTAMSVTIDTKVNAPVISSSTAAGSGGYLLNGTAEGNCTVSFFDGIKQVGTVKADASGAWSYTVSSLSVGTHSLTAKAVDVAGNTSAASTAVSAVVSGSGSSGPTGPTAPSAPVIAKFSDDSGVADDHITNDNTLTLSGTAVAGSAVKVFDGNQQVGTATADSTGNWSATSALADGAHKLSATATSGGQTSAASTAMSVTIDTKVNAPVISSSTAAGSGGYLLNGTAEGNSTVSFFDGIKQVGTVKADASGAWSYTVSSLSVGTHSLTAKAVDVAGNTSAASTAVSAVVQGAAPGTHTHTHTHTHTPTITTNISTGSGASATDHITNDTTLTLTGTAVAGSTVKVLDGTKSVGTATVDGSGHWTLTTPTLSDGAHKLTATGTNSSGHTSAASSALSLTIDSHAPGTPTMAVHSQGGATVGNTTTLDDLMLKGTAEANSTIKVFDGGKQVGTATTNSKGAWNFDTGHLNDGNHSFSASAADAAGNVSDASATKGVTVDSPTGPTEPTASVSFTNIYEHWNHTATIKGTGDASGQIRLYDGNDAVGSVKVGADGTWTYTTSSLSGTHGFTAQEVDSSGHAVATSSGQAVIGSNAGNTLTSTSGDDLFIGNGHHDTFVFAPNFGNDVIKDFAASCKSHDTIQFSHNEFDSFASVLSHASQAGQDVVISTGNDSLTLKNTKIGSLDSHDFHFA